MLENAVYSVISPEGCAAILWKDASQKERAAEALRLTATDLKDLGIIDEIIPEPVGGAHADPAADWPAAVIALGAELVAEGPKGKRTIKVDDFFKGLLTTALADNEILTEIRVQACGANVKCAYAKFPHPASRFAVVGVAAVLTMDGGGKVSKASIGITGAGTKATRAKGVEAAIAGKPADAASIQAAASSAAEGVDVQADLQGSVEYKQHLLRVFAKRAMEAAAAKK